MSGLPSNDTLRLAADWLRAYDPTDPDAVELARVAELIENLAHVVDVVDNITTWAYLQMMEEVENPQG